MKYYEFTYKRVGLKSPYLYGFMRVPWLVKFSVCLIGIHKFCLRFRLFVLGIEVSWGWDEA